MSKNAPSLAVLEEQRLRLVHILERFEMVLERLSPDAEPDEVQAINRQLDGIQKSLDSSENAFDS